MLEQIDGAPCQIGLLDGPAALARAIMTPEAMPHLQVRCCRLHGGNDAIMHAIFTLNYAGFGTVSAPGCVIPVAFHTGSTAADAGVLIIRLMSSLCVAQRLGVIDALVNLLAAAAREPTAAVAELSPRGVLAILQVTGHQAIPSQTPRLYPHARLPLTGTTCLSMPEACSTGSVSTHQSISISSCACTSTHVPGCCWHEQAARSASEQRVPDPLLLRQGVLPALAALLRAGHLSMLQAWPVRRGGGRAGACALLAAVADLLLGPLLPRARTSPEHMQLLHEVTAGWLATAACTLVCLYACTLCLVDASWLLCCPGAVAAAV